MRSNRLFYFFLAIGLAVSVVGAFEITAIDEAKGSPESVYRSSINAAVQEYAQDTKMDRELIPVVMNIMHQETNSHLSTFTLQHAGEKEARDTLIVGIMALISGIALMIVGVSFAEGDGEDVAPQPILSKNLSKTLH